MVRGRHEEEAVLQQPTAALRSMDGSDLAASLPGGRIAIGAAHEQAGGREHRLGVLEPIVVWSFVGTGLYATHRRPGSRVGILMVALGFAWCVAAISLANSAFACLAEHAQLDDEAELDRLRGQAGAADRDVLVSRIERRSSLLGHRRLGEPGVALNAVERAAEDDPRDRAPDVGERLMPSSLSRIDGSVSHTSIVS